MAAKLASTLLFVVTIASAYGGNISPNIWALPSILTLVFPYLFVASFVVGLLWLAFRKYIPAIVAGATIVICYPMAVFACPTSWSKSAKPGENCFTLLSYNIMSLQDQENSEEPYLRPLQYLLDSHADVICLQELYSLPSGKGLKSEAKALVDSLKAKYPVIIPGKTQDYCILSKYPVVEGKLTDEQKKLCRLYHMRINGARVDVISVHLASYCLSPDDREIVTDINSVNSAKQSISEFKHSVKQKLSSAFRERTEDAEIIRELLNTLEGNVIVCGDFNDVPCSWAYRKIKGDDLSDAYAHTGFGPLVTYNSHNFYFHIDQVLYRGDLEALDLTKGKIKCSDHYPLLTTFRIYDNNK